MIRRFAGVILAFIIMGASLNLYIVSGAESINAKAYLKIQTKNKVYPIFKDQLQFNFGEPLFYGLEDFAENICRENFVPPKNAQYYLDDNNAIKVKDQKYGETIDKERLKEDIKRGLAAGGGTVKAQYIKLYPDYKRQDLQSPVLRAEFTTLIKTIDENRLQNIKVCLNSLSAITFFANEEISFNNIVGERSAERGYKTAKVIVDGGFTDGLGGGVCQVSTTLYNACLLADLKINEWHRHSVAVSYVEKSFDAMVSYGYADLKIVNNTASPLFIVGFCNDKSLTFKVYGEKLQAKITRLSVICEEIEPDIIKIYTDNLKAGESLLKITPKKGYISQGYIVKTLNGKQSKTLIRSDTYKKTDGVLEVGR